MNTELAKIELEFMVVPELLQKLFDTGAIKDPVRCRIIDPDAIFLTGILGESGRRMVEGGIEFYFTRARAENLIAKGIAVEVTK